MVTVYWKAGASGNASTVANWNTALDGSGTDQAPATGDDVIFAQGGNCTWDIDGATAIPNSITLATGYTGTVTQGDVDISIGAGGFTQQAGTATFNDVKTVTCAGPFSQTAGSLTDSKLNLVMTGAGTTLSKATSGGILSLTANEDMTATSAGTFFTVYNLAIATGKILTIAEGKKLHFASASAASALANNGQVAGPGTLVIRRLNNDITMSIGAVTAPVEIYTAHGGVITMGANWVLGSSLTISSAHATNTITLDLNSKSLTCASLSIGTRGVLTGTGTLTADSITVGASGLFTDTNVTYDKTKVVGQTITWTAAEAANASATTSWSLNRAPFHNDNVVFDATSTNNCLWDIDASTVTVRSMTLATGYTGTLTQGDVDIGIGAGGFAMASGTFTGNDAKNIILENNANLTKTGGTFTADKAMLVVSGGNTITGSSIGPRSLTINGTVTLATSIRVYHTLSVGADGVLTIGTGATLTLSSYNNANPYSNLGSINGPGTLSLWYYNQNENFAFGAVTAPMEVRLVGGGAASCTHILSADTTFGSAVKIFSDDGIKTMTLDLAGFNLNARGITVGTRGVLLGGEGVIRNYGNFDSSAGAADFGTSQYVQASGGTIKLGAGQQLYDVEAPSAPLDLASDVTITGKYRHLRSAKLNGFTLTFDPSKEVRMLDDMTAMSARRTRIIAVAGGP